MVTGQPAVGEKSAEAPSRAAQQAGRGAPARRRPRNGQHLLGRRSDGWRRAHVWRRHQPRGTRARAAAAHPAARSRTPTCDGRWRCRRTPPRARRSPPPHASVGQQPSGRCHGAASAGHVSTRRKRRHSPHAPRGTAAGAEGWAARRGRARRHDGARRGRAHAAGSRRAPGRRAHLRTAPVQPGARAPACSGSGMRPKPARVTGGSRLTGVNTSCIIPP